MQGDQILLFLLSEIQRLQKRESTLELVCKQAIDELENSRKQLSRELHDELGQAMTSILLQLKILQQEQDIEVIHDRLGGLRYLTQQTIEDVRRLAMNLRPMVLENLGLAAALEWYLEDYGRYSGILVEFSSPRINKRFHSDIESTVYRAVQESLTNVARHSQATKVSVKLNIHEENLSLQVADNGVGMVPENKYKGIGLLGMEERVKLARGEFRMESQPGQGTVIEMMLPIRYEGE